MKISSLFSQLLRLVKPDATDENWKFFGEKAAYFGVVNWPQFRPENLNEETRQEFLKPENTTSSNSSESSIERSLRDFSPARQSTSDVESGG